MNKYLFLRFDEEGVTAKLTTQLDDFCDFCHYAKSSDRNELVKYIKREIKKTGRYDFVGNDISYYVMTYYAWGSFNIKELSIEIDNK